MKYKKRTFAGSRLRTVQTAGVVLLAAALEGGCSAGKREAQNPQAAQSRVKTVKVTPVTKPSYKVRSLNMASFLFPFTMIIRK